MIANILWYNPPGAILSEGLYPDGVIEDSKNHEEMLRFKTDWFYHGFRLHVPRLGFGASRDTAMLDYFRRNRGRDATGNPIPAGSPLVDLTDTPYTSTTQRDRSRNNWYLFVQDSWTFMPGWELTAGIHYDDYSDFGTTTNPRAALVWQITPNFTSKLLYTSAFRAPTFQEMYLNNPLLHGNRNLQPETINAYELAFDWRASEIFSQTLNLYYFEIKDKILPITGIDYPQFLNNGEREGAGAELEIRWKLSTRASLLFNYAYADNIVKPQTGQSQNEHRETGYPRHTGYLRLDWMFQPNCYIDSQAYWAADYARPPDYQYSKRDDNFSVDLTLRYKKAHDWDWNLAIGLHNLFDQDLREPARGGVIINDFPSGGRTWFAEVRYHFFFKTGLQSVALSVANNCKIINPI